MAMLGIRLGESIGQDLGFFALMTVLLTAATWLLVELFEGW
jgi:hypothetical protein